MNHTVAIIQIEGSLDVTNSDALRQDIIKTLDQDASHLLVDCQKVTFMDSSGLSALVMALKLARESSVRFALCAVGEQAAMMFRLTGMDKVFDIFEDRAAFEETLLQPVQV
ncbi:MAG: STAS domain-containing protein [Cyanobacteria bacterium P01_D01_bin.105]